MDFDSITEQVNALNKQYRAGYNAAKDDLRLRLHILAAKPTPTDPLDRAGEIIHAVAEFLR